MINAQRPDLQQYGSLKVSFPHYFSMWKSTQISKILLSDWLSVTMIRELKTFSWLNSELSCNHIIHRIVNEYALLLLQPTVHSQLLLFGFFNVKKDIFEGTMASVGQEDRCFWKEVWHIKDKFNFTMLLWNNIVKKLYIDLEEVWG